MNYCIGCVDYNPETKICMPTGEDAGPSVVYCIDKRLYLTNGDKIRDMTDEELAVFLAQYWDSWNCSKYTDHCMADEDGCSKAVLKWLGEKYEQPRQD